jgi:hypothetical protein
MVERFRFKGYRDMSVTLDGRVDDREMGLTDRGRYGGCRGIWVDYFEIAKETRTAVPASFRARVAMLIQFRHTTPRRLTG